MCLTTPRQIKTITGQIAELNDGRKVKIDLIKNAKSGDWVLVNADLAISKVSKKEAQEINNYFQKK